MALSQGNSAAALARGEQVESATELFGLCEKVGHIEQRHNRALVLLPQNSALARVALLKKRQRTVMLRKRAVARSELRET